jgi:DNA helicase-2/ATP-dependent DNA helicase PcrA
MTSQLEIALSKLTDVQRDAVTWDQGPLLVLAGPGSGKTQVLTCRIAHLLDSSREKKFRVLALTFTNKAADEMKQRVAAFVPGLEERAVIGTFHSFCAHVLRQHGVHIGIKPDFNIYSRDVDRQRVLEDALQRAADEGASIAGDVKYLAMIDRLKARLIEPDGADTVLARFPDRESIKATYRLYEDELRRTNSLDFNSLIFEAYRLVKTFPAIANQYQRSHPYWLIDEFQDTNRAQYRFVRTLSGDSFRNVLAVADDDQIIYAWNGASYKQIQSFLTDFSAESIQLSTNYRCPPAIVAAANRLVAYNAQRSAGKQPLIAGKTELKYSVEDQIQLRVFSTEDEEAEKIAEDIAGRGSTEWGQTAVLARNRGLLERMHQALTECQVPAVIAQRRDDFLSPQFRWLVAVLRQVTHPLDRTNLAVLIESFNRMAQIDVSLELAISEAETSGRSYFAIWLEAAASNNLSVSHAALLNLIETSLAGTTATKGTIEEILAEFEKEIADANVPSDLAEDLLAWRQLTRDIAVHIGRNAPIDQFLQELQLRSKEPTPKPNSVTLMTIHGAKGKEFDFVYVVGLAEDVMPSYQSRQKGDNSPEMEEERRNCFVAITRAKECVVLSRAEQYRGWRKHPSRFLVEMSLAA